MRKKTFLILAVLFGTLLFSQCSSDNDDDEPEASIKFSQDTVTITTDTYIIPIIYSSEKIKTQDYAIFSSDDSIADLSLNEDGNISVTKKKKGQTTINIISKDGSLKASCYLEIKIGVVKKWVAFGNSITKHPISSFWWGEWGMAATKEEYDYIHVLKKLIDKEYDVDSSFKAVNIAAWERDFDGFDKALIKNSIDGDEDLIIIRLGENVASTTEVYSIYQDKLNELIVYMKTLNSKANFIVTGNFWTNENKDVIQKTVAEKNNCLWISLKHLDTPDNKSTTDTKVFGADGNWHTISDGGDKASAVASHPGNKGMEGIANAIYLTIK